MDSTPIVAGYIRVSSARQRDESDSPASQRQRLEAATEVMQFCGAEDFTARQQFQRVLLGFGDYSAAELVEAWQAERPSERQWINAWRRSLGLKTDGPTPPWEG